MSLTTKLAGKSENDKKFQFIIQSLFPAKECYYTGSGKKPFSNEYETLAPYELSKPYLATVVGTAFDYLARILVARVIHKSKCSAYTGFAAARGLSILENGVNIDLYRELSQKYIDCLSIFMEYVQGDLCKIEFLDLSRASQEEICAYRCVKEKESKLNYSNNITINELCHAAYYFAKVEHIMRSGILPENIKTSLLNEPEEEVIKDLAQLCSVFSDAFVFSGRVTVDSDVVFNPTFGVLIPMCIGGADADIYIDGSLYDFKTTKDYSYKWQNIAQLLGYYLLYLAAIALNEPRFSLNGYVVEKVAFYKARAGEIEYLNISSLGKDKILNALHSFVSFFNMKIDSEFDEYFEEQLFK